MATYTIQCTEEKLIFPDGGTNLNVDCGDSVVFQGEARLQQRVHVYGPKDIPGSSLFGTDDIPVPDKDLPPEPKQVSDNAKKGQIYEIHLKNGTGKNDSMNGTITVNPGTGGHGPGKP